MKHGRALYKNNAVRCRCDECRDDVRLEQAARRKAQALGIHQPAIVDAIGTKRRLQALMCVGYSLQDVATAIGWNRGNLQRTLTYRDNCGRRTHDLVADFYEQHWDKPPTTWQSGRTRNLAKRKGFVPPMGWDDDEIDDPLAEPHWGAAVDVVDHQAIDRVVKGDMKVVLTQTERLVAAKTMFDLGFTKKLIIARLHMSTETIDKAIAA